MIRARPRISFLSTFDSGSCLTQDTSVLCISAPSFERPLAPLKFTTFSTITQSLVPQPTPSQMLYQSLQWLTRLCHSRPADLVAALLLAGGLVQPHLR